MQKLIYGIGGFVVILLLIGFALPSQSRFVVTAEIDAPRATVFALINDMHRVNLWAPYTETDPNAQVVYSGPTRGRGATVTWDGVVVGSGTQTITESRPWEYIEIVINAGEAGESRTRFDLGQGTGTTIVNWGFEHDYGLNVIGRYVGLMVTGVLKRDYEQHIVALKELAESLPRTDFSDVEIEHLTVESAEVAYLPTTSAPDPSATSEAMGDALFEVLSFIDDHNLAEAGAPIAIARAFSGAELRFDTAIPVRGISDDTPRNTSGVRIGRTYEGPVIRVKHVGSYRTLGVTHRKIAAYLAALGIERNGDSWESYVSDPTKTDEAELITYIYYPIRVL